MSVEFSIPGNLGNIAGPATDGVLVGQMTATDPDMVLLKTHAVSSTLAYQDDGGLYTSFTTEANEGTANDVDLLPATPAVDDAFYFGSATYTFSQIDIVSSTQGAGTWTITWEYWTGSAWASLAGVTDGTTGFTAATGTQKVTFTLPTDWAKCTVDSTLAYWVRARVSAYTSVTTQPLATRVYLKSTTATWTDDTTDFTDAGTGDVALLPSYAFVGDGLYIGYAEKFCKVKVTVSQARTGTATLVLKYWDGSAWTAVTTYDDDAAGWSTGTSTYYIHFAPPSDWTANTADDGPNGEAGYFVAVEMTAHTSYTQQPLGTQGWVYPLKTGATGVRVRETGTTWHVTAMAQTPSGTTANSVFLLVNTTTGNCDTFTWTKGDAMVSEDLSLSAAQGAQFALVQVTEDGTTEFADAFFSIGTE